MNHFQRLRERKTKRKNVFSTIKLSYINVFMSAFLTSRLQSRLRLMFGETYTFYRRMGNPEKYIQSCNASSVNYAVEINI